MTVLLKELQTVQTLHRSAVLLYYLKVCVLRTRGSGLCSGVWRPPARRHCTFWLGDSVWLMELVRGGERMWMEQAKVIDIHYCMSVHWKCFFFFWGGCIWYMKWISQFSTSEICATRCHILQCGLGLRPCSFWKSKPQQGLLSLSFETNGTFNTVVQ